MSCGRLFPRLPGRLITFRQSFLIFHARLYLQFFYFPAPARRRSHPGWTFSFIELELSGGLPEQSPACCLFFSSGSHQICISSSKSSVYLALHSRASAVHLTLICFRTKAGEKMTRCDQMLLFVFHSEHNESVCTGARRQLPGIMCW